AVEDRTPLARLTRVGRRAETRAEDVLEPKVAGAGRQHERVDGAAADVVANRVELRIERRVAGNDAAVRRQQPALALGAGDGAVAVPVAADSAAGAGERNERDRRTDVRELEPPRRL